MLTPPCVLRASLSLRRAVAVVGGFEDVVGVGRGGREDARQLRVPVQFLDVLLPLVHEVELRRNVAQVFAPRLATRGAGGAAW